MTFDFECRSSSNSSFFYKQNDLNSKHSFFSISLESRSLFPFILSLCIFIIQGNGIGLNFCSNFQMQKDEHFAKKKTTNCVMKMWIFYMFFFFGIKGSREIVCGRMLLVSWHTHKMVIKSRKIAIDFSPNHLLLQMTNANKINNKWRSIFDVKLNQLPKSKIFFCALNGGNVVFSCFFVVVLPREKHFCFCLNIILITIYHTCWLASASSIVRWISKWTLLLHFLTQTHCFNY